MRVLSAVSECVPLVKTGGLADVAGALPAALAPEGVEMRTLLPAYPGLLDRLDPGAETVRDWADLFGGPARLVAGRAGDLDLLLLDAPHLFARDGTPYLDARGHDWPDNPERFAALSWAAMELARDGAGGWHPALVHAHDWQTALAPHYLAAQGVGVPALLTIHNIAFQGIAPPDRLDALRLDGRDFHPGAVEFYGQISALKAGLMAAQAITTVSPTYARELTTPEFGMGLDGVLRHRRADLHGILNGIDAAAWNPATDPAIAPYDAPPGKAANRAALLAEFGLPDGDGPLCIVVSRLTGQKGLDLLLDALPALLDGGGQLALLGSGDRAMEQAWQDAAERHAGVAVRIGYDEPLSHRMMAGADAIVIPSRFEPCGLTQLYALRYGTVPVVGLTGGLADTVIPANDAGLKRGVATGLHVHPLTVDSLRTALETLCALYRDGEVWTSLQRNAMAHPVGWDRSARAYAALYRQLTDG